MTTASHFFSTLPARPFALIYHRRSDEIAVVISRWEWGRALTPVGVSSIHRRVSHLGKSGRGNGHDTRRCGWRSGHNCSARF
jgi:hypothetical protein